MSDKLISLEEMQHVFGWHGHAAYFNTQQPAFPQPVVEENGVKFYNLDEIVAWEHDRPLGESINNDQIWLTTFKNGYM